MRVRSTTAVLLTFLLGLLVALPARAQSGLPWPNETRGAPFFEPGKALGYFIWTDDETVHVRWTTKGATRRFSGRMTTDGQVLEFRRTRIESGDLVRRVGNTVSWDAQNTGFTDGFDFSVSRSADWVLFALNIDGRAATPDQIFLGNQRNHPAAGPFVLRRAGLQAGWPASARGQPGFEVGGSLGYFLWHDADGWHLRWTTRGRTRVFSGTISTTGVFHDVRRVALESSDLSLRTSALLAWRSSNTGGLDGFDFSTTGDRLTFSLVLDGFPVAMNQIYVGAGRSHPSSNPFTLTR